MHLFIYDILKKHFLFTSWYLFVCAINFYSMVTVNTVLRLFAMPAIGMSIIFYFLVQTKLKGSYNQTIFIGLMLAMAGDVEVIFAEDASFLFLAAVIATISSYAMYISAFVKDLDIATVELKLTWAIAFFGFISIAFYLLVANKLEDFKLPVIVHLVMLAVLNITSFSRLRNKSNLSSVLIFCSSLLFLISDYSIGYSTFAVFSKPLMQVYLISYQLALYLLVIGSLERKNMEAAAGNFS